MISNSSSSSNSNNSNSSSHRPASAWVRLCAAGIASSPCGYCHGSRASKGRECSTSYGFLPSQITPALYEQLLHRGWRRSGSHVYKPIQMTSCCPALTIRLHVPSFVPTKSQRRVLKRVTTIETTTKKSQLPTQLQVPFQLQSTRTKRRPSLPIPAPIPAPVPVPALWSQWTKEALIAILPPHTKIPTVVYKPVPNTFHRQIRTTICAAIAGPSKGMVQPQVLAEQVVQFIQERYGLAMTIHQPTGQLLVTTNDSDHCMQDQESTPPALANGTTIPQLPPPPPPSSPSPLQITTIPAMESALDPEVHNLYFDYQHIIHNDLHPSHPSNDDIMEEEEDWGEASLDFKTRAIAMLEQHHAPSTWTAIKAMYSAFYRFLVESPLISHTYHQHYRFNQQLVAVGVVDVLPNGVSSVYAFYDPHLTNMSLGKLAILKEIEFTKSLNKPYYYLGYYIESCTKMRYKIDYGPSELLCPTHYQWVDAKEGQAKLQQDPHQCCTLYTGAVPLLPTPEEDWINTIRLDMGQPTTMTLPMLTTAGQDMIRPHVEEFLYHVGPEIAKECIIRLE